MNWKLKILTWEEFSKLPVDSTVFLSWKLPPKTSESFPDYLVEILKHTKMDGDLLLDALPMKVLYTTDYGVRIEYSHPSRDECFVISTDLKYINVYYYEKETNFQDLCKKIQDKYRKQ